MRATLLACASSLLTCGITAAQPPGDLRLDCPGSSPRIFVCHQPPRHSSKGLAHRPVLFVHGATFPSALSAGYRLRGRSWMDDLAGAGYDVWALDFLGYGESDRYPEMAEPAGVHPPLGSAPEAERQIECAARAVLARTGAQRLALIAHSWGTLPAGRFAAAHPELVESLVLYGPIAPGSERSLVETLPAFLEVTLEQQWEAFRQDIPASHPMAGMARRDFDVWGRAYLASAPAVAGNPPRSVRVPSGPIADSQEAECGSLPYDPGQIRAPTLVVRGGWDSITTAAGARRIFDALDGARSRQLLTIPHGTHRLHLEPNRFGLYRAVRRFLATVRSSPPTEKGAPKGS